jgi:gas vesicle protein
MAKSKKKGGFIFGAVIGAVAGVLLAPKTGRELRQQLFGGGLDLDQQKSRLQDAMNAGREQAADRSETLKQKIEETRRRLRDQLS